jgi:hypothetical protein
MIIGGVIVAIIVAILGINSTKVVVSHGSVKKKTGRWIIFLSWCAIIVGILWIGNSSTLHSGGIDLNNHNTLYGLTLLMWGVIALVVGKIIKYFQD